MDRQKTSVGKAGTMNRRSAIKLAGGAGAAALTVGSAASMSQAAPAVLQATPSVGQPFPVLVEQPPITIYDYGVELPTEDITFRWADHQGVRVPFQQALHAAFMEAYPNITIEYDSLGADLAELLVVGVQSGDAHDIMPSNAGFPVAQGVAEGWLAPLDDVIPDFDAWKSAYPENTFFPGINVFDDKTYSCPIYSSKVHRELLYFNSELLEQAGYDPGTTTLTWDDFRAATRTVTEQGGGDSFGMLIEQGGFGQFINTLAEIAGASGGEFNWLTGEYNYTSDQFLAAIELMMAMKDDGSFLPGMTSLTGTDVRSRFPDAISAFYLSGTWNVSIWEQERPEFAFGVTSAPVPNEGEAFPLTKAPGNADSYVVYSGSQYKSVAGALLRFAGSLEGNIALKEISKTINPVAFPEADALVEASQVGRRALELNESQLRYEPHPAVRNVDATIVEMQRRPVTPSFTEVVEGIFTGQVGDAQQAMQDLQDRSNAELDRAIQAAVDEGAEVSRDDWVFPNWDPREDYGLEKYDEL